MNEIRRTSPRDRPGPAKAKVLLEHLGGAAPNPQATAQWRRSRSSSTTPTATALYDPKDPFDEAVAAVYVQASGGLGDLSAPVLSLTAGDTERPGLLSYIKACGSSGSRRSTPTPRSPPPHS